MGTSALARAFYGKAKVVLVEPLGATLRFSSVGYFSLSHGDSGTRQSRKFRSSYVADAGGSVSEAMHAVSRRRI